MQGSPCPSCGQQVMSFRDFFLKAEPYKTFRCAGCGTELDRSSGVWIAVIIFGVAAGIGGGLLGLQADRLGAAAVLAIGVVTILVGVLAVKVVNYRLGLWRVKGRPAASA